jgi:hypothetical protein
MNVAFEVLTSTPIDEIAGGSPGWWSGNAEIRRSARPGLLVKVPRRHASRVGTADNHARSRVALGEAGLGPRVLLHDGEVIVQEELRHEEWQVLTFTRLMREGRLARFTNLHTEIASSVQGLQETAPITQLAKLRAVMADLGVHAAPEIAVAERVLEQVGDRLDSGRPRVTFLGDCSCSNAMVRRDGTEMRAVGGTLAVATDPVHVAGALVAELVPYVTDAWHVLQALRGSLVETDDVTFARANLYALAEDVKWVYISRIASANAFESRFNSSVYSMVRARRAELVIRQGQYRRWMEAIA